MILTTHAKFNDTNHTWDNKVSLGLLCVIQVKAVSQSEWRDLCMCGWAWIIHVLAGNAESLWLDCVSKKALFLCGEGPKYCAKDTQACNFVHSTFIVSLAEDWGTCNCFVGFFFWFFFFANHKFFYSNLRL